MQNILFSPIGKTDPYRGGYEGPMLHIARHYSPAKAYLFLTEEMGKDEKKDGRFSRSLLKLSEMLGFKCDVELIFSDIKDPSDFDAFLHQFKEKISEIRNSNPGSRIILNITSGTPQMEATLCIIASTGEEDMCCVQVKTPVRQANVDVAFSKDYDVGDIENLFDNLPEAENRCSEPEILLYRNTFIREKVKSMISNYDYTGALHAASIYPSAFPQKAHKILKHLDKRSRWDLKGADKELAEINDCGFKWYATADFKARNVSEYFLCMKIKHIRKEMSDFILRISPFLTTMCEDFIKDILRFPLDDYISTDNNGVRKITRKALSKNPSLLTYMDSQFGEKYRNNFVSFNTLNMIARYVCEQDKKDKEYGDILSCFEKMREVEHRVRNISAHQMEYIDDDFIIAKTGISSKKVMEILKQLAVEIYKPLLTGDFAARYDAINKYVLNLIDASE
jgi:CRISPR type III-A/MTUBE-associated protein Csm6